VEELKLRLGIARRSLSTLQEVLREPTTPIVRDAAIQRFEYSFETAWKAGQRYLLDREGLDHPSPARVVRGCHAVGLLDDAQARLALRMIEDRNRTVHTYNERLAVEISGRLASYCALIEAWLDAMERKPAGPDGEPTGGVR
jgi:nucleotidyltransferase substrate binding protein (TIGR01987 family)